MKRLPPQTIFKLGYLICRLGKYQPGVQVYLDYSGTTHKHGQTCLLGDLSDVRDIMADYNLGREWLAKIDPLIEDFKITYRRASSPNLSSRDHSRFMSITQQLHGVLRNEIGNRIMVDFPYASWGGLNYRRLLRKGPILLFEDYKALKFIKIIESDLQEAVEALVFGLPTACAMLSFRASEAIVRRLFQEMGGTGNKTWSEITKALPQLMEEKNLESSPLVGYLDYIRKKRNQAEHPEKTFSPTVAEHILTNSVSLIEEVYQLIQRNKGE